MKYFKLKFLLLFAALAVAIPSAWAATVEFDFTTNDWGIPTGNSNNITQGTNTYTSGDYTITLTCTTGSGYSSHGYYYNNTSHYLMMCRSSARLILPAFDKVVNKIEVICTTGTNSSAKQNIFLGSTNTPVSAETNSAGTHDYVINENYKDLGTIYSLKMTASANAQVQKVIVYLEDSGDEPVLVAPVFDPEDGTKFDNTLEVSLTCATEGATIKYGFNEDYQEADYSEPIIIDETTTIYAKSILGDEESEVVSATYTKNAPEPPGPEPTDNVYVKLTDVGNVPSGTYLIVCEDQNLAFDGSLNTLDAVGNFIEVDINRANTIQGTEEIDAATFTYDATNNTLKSASSKYIGQTSNANGLLADANIEYTNTVTINEGYNADIIGSGGAYLRYNDSSNQTRFRYYKTSSYASQKAIQLYKLVEPIVEPEMTVALTAAPAEAYTVGDNVTVYATVENGSEETMVTYKINGGEEQEYTNAGIVLPNTAAGDVVVTVYALDGEKEATDTVTYHFNAAQAFAITLTPDGSAEYTVGDKVNVKVGVENNIANYTITYSIDRAEETYDPEKGIDIPNDRAGDVTLTVNVADGYDHQGTSSATATYHFNAAPAIEVTLNPASGTYFLDEQATVTVSTLNTIGDAMITYQIGDGEPMDYENGITISAQEAGTVNLTVTVADGYHEGVATATGEYTFVARPVADAPVFSLASGTYGDTQSLQITGANGATIYYTTDGTEPTTESAVYSGAIALGEGKTIVKAIAVVDGMTNSAVANAYYIIDIPEEVTPLTNGAITGFYAVKNNGNEQYVDIRGRKTLTFTNDIDKKPGTVIWIETDENGQVQSLRSQGADLQGYANRAMKYVPEIVELAVEKLHAEGSGEILGANGLDEMMDKFKECFDHHLYVEEATGGYRLYGKTPSMQHVVDFYREHTHQVETKLPKLEEFINSAITKVLEKTGGKGGSILKPFSLHQTWQRMDSALVNANLTEPLDSATTMEFYRQVLNDKNYVWQFAYETAMTYWERIKNHPKYETYFKPTLGEFADYIERIEDVHPDFKYYVVQENNKPDYVSQGNKDILENNGRTIWTIESRDSFKVNFSLTEDNQAYYTTLYTDFAYTLPEEGVEAYIVTAIDGQGNTLTQKVTGTIPAQTPILLKANAAGDQVLTLATAGNADVSGNLLVGADHFINEYKLKTEQVATLFDLALDILGETFYNNYIAKYEHLMYKNAGTVNNKYFWGLTDNDLFECNNDGVCVVRSLSNGDNGLGFYDNMTAGANQAFLDDYTFNPVKLVVKNDVTRDGVWDIDDVTATISIILGTAPEPNNYDYVAADFNEDGTIDIDDVTAMISYILGI